MYIFIWSYDQFIKANKIYKIIIYKTILKFKSLIKYHLHKK